MRLEAPLGGCLVRMYRHGLGDCFLLAFGTKKGTQKYMLIDCGVLMGTENADAEMNRVVSNINEATNGHLDILVITHEHWDHISGFVQAQEEFNKIQVDQVWMAWTEDPKNPLARELRKRRNTVLDAMNTALTKIGLELSKSAYSMRVKSIWDFFGTELGATRVRTEDALDWIKKKWTNHIYCKPGGEPITITGLPNVRFFVLGPPIDAEYIRKSRPSKSDVYIRDIGDIALKERTYFEKDTWRPFNPAFMRESSEDYWKSEIDYRYRSEKWRIIDNDWLDKVGELALQLDEHTNNTSLVLAIEISPSGQVLLFPGDAQVGNWLSWEDVTWSDNISIKDLLANTVLYKVGHHGSHNATLKEKGLERMTNSSLAAIIPVNCKMAAKMKWRMPHKPLWDRLTELTSGRVVLADKGLPEAGDNESVIDFRKICSETNLYIDVKITAKP